MYFHMKQNLYYLLHENGMGSFDQIDKGQMKYSVIHAIIILYFFQNHISTIYEQNRNTFANPFPVCILACVLMDQNKINNNGP